MYLGRPRVCRTRALVVLHLQLPRASVEPSLRKQSRSVGWYGVSLYLGAWPAPTPLVKLCAHETAFTHTPCQIGKGALWPLPLCHIAVTRCRSMSRLEGTDVLGSIWCRAPAQGNVRGLPGWRRRCALRDQRARWSGGNGLGGRFGVRSPVSWLCDRWQVGTSRNVGLVIRKGRCYLLLGGVWGIE